jgi:hypothetical protein
MKNTGVGELIIRRKPDGKYTFEVTPEGESRRISGSEMISTERERQVTSEGWTPEHDDEHDKAELAQAAGYYLHEAIIKTKYGTNSLHYEHPIRWPWEEKSWKPSEDPARNLVKAGALIAAEIDRLSRQNA